MRLDIGSRKLVAVIAVAFAIGAAVFWASPRKVAKHADLAARPEAERGNVTPPASVPADTEVTRPDEPSAELVAPTSTPEPVASATVPAKELACPAREPAAGSACTTSTDAGLRCVYQRRTDEILCICEPSVAHTWDCKKIEEDPPVAPCPSAQPATSSSCSAPDQLCVYGVGEAAQACQCKRDELLWSCISYQTWRGEK